MFLVLLQATPRSLAPLETICLREVQRPNQKHRSGGGIRTSKTNNAATDEASYRRVPGVVFLPYIGSCYSSEFVASANCSCLLIRTWLPGKGRWDCSVPKIPIVPPVLVRTPQPVTFCRVRLFCTADRKSPAPPTIIVDRTDALIASLGW